LGEPKNLQQRISFQSPKKGKDKSKLFFLQIDHGSWIESSHGTAAAVVAAVAANHPHHHHQHPGVVDSYPDYSIQRYRY